MPSTDLRREVGVVGATALVVGHVIAVGIFLTPGAIIRTIASPLGVMLLWSAMGALAICGALCYGALAARYPEAGGGYVYLREVYGPSVAFLYGWQCLLIMDPGITAALATGFAKYVDALVPLGDLSLRLVAIAAIGTFAIVHIGGVRIGARVLNGVSFLKVALVAALMVGALASTEGSWSHFEPLVARRDGAMPLGGAAAGGFVAAFFSFGGWWEVTRIAGEVRQPSRNVPRALLFGLLIVTVVYTTLTIAFLYLVPIERVSEGQAFATQIGQAIMGRGGGTMVALVVIVCVLGSMAALQMMAPRTYFAMARDGALPSAIAVIDPRFGTPMRAIATQAALASIMVAVGTFETIVAYFVFVAVVFLTATVASVFVLRRRDPAFHVPGYPLTPSAFVAMGVMLLALLLASNPFQAVLGIGLVALAIPVYRFVRPTAKIGGAGYRVI
ncbi:MAG TPA: amino acid permease [Gemmatimonadaceae bacterium]|nr:amino acid permease [Gemmatimonadaceae bacterium]